MNCIPVELADNISHTSHDTNGTGPMPSGDGMFESPSSEENDDTMVKVEMFLYSKVVAFICVVGIVGNLLNVTVLTRRRLQAGMTTMERTVYLRLAALALSDMMFCLCVLPHAWVNRQQFYFQERGFEFYYLIYGNGLINIFVMMSTWLTVGMAASRNDMTTQPCLLFSDVKVDFYEHPNGYLTTMAVKHDDTDAQGCIPLSLTHIYIDTHLLLSNTTMLHRKYNITISIGVCYLKQLVNRHMSMRRMASNKPADLAPVDDDAWEYVEFYDKDYDNASIKPEYHCNVSSLQESPTKLRDPVGYADHIEHSNQNISDISAKGRVQTSDQRDYNHESHQPRLVNNRRSNIHALNENLYKYVAKNLGHKIFSTSVSPSPPPLPPREETCFHTNKNTSNISSVVIPESSDHNNFKGPVVRLSSGSLFDYTGGGQGHLPLPERLQQKVDVADLNGDRHFDTEKGNHRCLPCSPETCCLITTTYSALVIVLVILFIILTVVFIYLGLFT